MEFLFALWLWQPIVGTSSSHHYGWREQGVVFETKQLCDDAAKELVTTRSVLQKNPGFANNEWVDTPNPHRCLPIGKKSRGQ